MVNLLGLLMFGFYRLFIAFFYLGMIAFPLGYWGWLIVGRLLGGCAC